MTCIEESTQQSIGHLLLEDGRIDDEMLSYALKVQQVSRERLGDILQHLRLVTDRDIAWVVAKQAKLEYNPMLVVTSSEEALDQIPSSFAQKHGLLPLSIRK
jgi:hypothetical protein